jgi:hypothetical protein
LLPNDSMDVSRKGAQQRRGAGRLVIEVAKVYLNALQRICGLGRRMQGVRGCTRIAGISKLSAALVNAAQAMRGLHSKARGGPRISWEAGGAAEKGYPIESLQTATVETSTIKDELGQTSKPKRFALSAGAAWIQRRRMQAHAPLACI